MSLASIAALDVFSLTFIFALRKDGYRHWEHTISELGETGSPVQLAVAIGFGMIAAFVLTSLWLASWSLPTALNPVLYAYGLLGVSYAVAAFFPCDPGVPASGTMTNAVHLAGGVAGYIGPLWALRELIELAPPPFTPLLWNALATVVLVGVAILFLVRRLRGLGQRIAEVALFAGLHRADDCRRDA